MTKQKQGPLARWAAEKRGQKEDEIAKLRAEYEESPEYRLGCELIDGLTQELGITAQQAAEMLSSGAHPGGMDVLSRKYAATLNEMEQAGKLGRPAGEYLDSDAFAQLMQELPLSAAVRVFEAEEAARSAKEQAGMDAEQAVLEKIRAQRALPASLRSGIPTSAEPDFARMSSEEFERFKQRYFSR